MSQDAVPTSQETKLKDALMQSQQDCIAALKLNLQLLDEKLGTAVQAAEIWKQRYDNLEKQALDLQSKYLAATRPAVPSPAAVVAPVNPDN